LPGKESKAHIASAPSERFDLSDSDGKSVWTATEQKLLEQALLTFPKDTPKRWDRIAESIPGRSKESCIKRFKELAAMVQAKKEALKAVKKPSSISKPI
jgi:DnaJ family protein C protein 2